MSNDEEKIFDGELLPEKSSSPLPTSGESHLAKIADMEAETAIEYFKNRVKVLENITLLAIGSTRHTDWVKMGNKMYCQISGTSRIMRNLGCIYQIIDLKKTFSKDSQGQYYKYTATINISHPAIGSEQNIGSATQKDKFFLAGAKNNREMVNESDVEKKAVTNGIGRAARILFGLNDVTEEMVRKNVQGKGDFATIDYDPETGAKFKEPSINDVKDKPPYPPESMNVGDKDNPPGDITDQYVRQQPGDGDPQSIFEALVVSYYMDNPDTDLGDTAQQMAEKWLFDHTGGKGPDGTEYKPKSKFMWLSEKQVYRFKKIFAQQKGIKL